ncbi:MAG: hypothetical protein AB7G75_06070 [Candidatus Binatia bacterium]
MIPSLIQPRLLTCVGVFLAVFGAPHLVFSSPLTLSWTDNASTELGFKVERRTHTSGTYTQIATVSANSTSYSDSTATPGETYCYRVRSFNESGDSPYSNEACGQVAPVIQKVSLSVSVVGEGSVRSNPVGVSCTPACTQTYTTGTIVTLTAIADTGWRFAGWNGGCTGQSKECPVTMTQTQNVTASFSKIVTQPTLSQTGVFRRGAWYLDSGNGRWEGCSVDTCFAFGYPDDYPVIGDWTGDGHKDVGVFRRGAWYLDSGNGRWDGCGTDRCYGFGAPGDQPVMGDWNGNGREKIGVFRNGTWYLDTGNGRWDGCGTDICISSFGLIGDQAIAGDWNGDGRTEIGVYRRGAWYLDTGNGRWDGCGIDICLSGYGYATDFAIVGDWNGDGRTEIGVFRNGSWYLDTGNKRWDGCGVDICWSGLGTSGDVPISGMH